MMPVFSAAIFAFGLCMVAICAHSRRNHRKHRSYYNKSTTTSQKPTHKICRKIGATMRARHKVCFLRPDTGPCRADIVQWYYDAKQTRCYRFYWGGCQGNGNKFETIKECHNHCYLNISTKTTDIPHFCSLTFEYGTCFGHYYRWSWDNFSKTCRRHLYSGCGGNQNNFETKTACLASCLKPPNNNLQNHNFITCVPYHYEKNK